MALGVASSLACGLKANFGTLTKSFQVGWAAKTGVVSCMVVKAGLTANKNAITDKYGFLEAFGGIGQARICAQEGELLEIINPGLYVKLYPCCASTHSSVDAALDLVRENELDTSYIERVTCYLDERRTGYIDRPQPRDELEAKFSVQYCVAAALTDGRVELRTFTAERFEDRKLRELTGKVRGLGTAAQGNDQEFRSTVVVKMKDGLVRRAEVMSPRGAGGYQSEAVIRKFRSCVSGIIPLPAADQIKRTVMEDRYDLHPVRIIGDVLRNGMINQDQAKFI